MKRQTHIGFSSLRQQSWGRLPPERGPPDTQCNTLYGFARGGRRSARHSHQIIYVKKANPMAFRCLKRCLKRQNQAFRCFTRRFRHRNTVSNAVQHRFRQLWHFGAQACSSLLRPVAVDSSTASKDLSLPAAAGTGPMEKSGDGGQEGRAWLQKQ